MSYEYDEENYAEDPFANPYGMDEQTMVDFLVANGVGAGLLPTVQPGTGRALTVANRTSALSANRQGLFDTAFQGGMGGADAFAPDAFQPTISTTIRQEPELQQMYGYLRAPDSYEGLIANEILNGGNASTALRKIRELLAAETTDPALKASLLLELPQRLPMEGAPALELTPENVNWDAGDDSVAGRAREINELYAQIPRVGPTGPQWGTDPTTGQPIQISSGGELHWGEDESGNPVLMETTTTPSEAAKVFTDLGLPTPADEYMTEDFLPAGWQDQMAQYTEGARPAEQAALQQWLTAQAENRPSWEETMTPYKEGFAPGGGGVGPPEQPDYSPLPEGAYGAWNDPNEPDRTEAAAWQELMSGSQFGGWHTTNPLQRRTAEDAMREAQTNAYGSWETLNQGETAAPGDPRDYAYGDWNAPEGGAAPPPNTASDARQAWLAAQEYLANPSAASAPGYGSWEILNQSGQAQPPVDPTAVYGGWNTATPAAAPPSGPSGNPVAQMLEFLIGQATPANAQSGAQPANQPGGPAYMAQYDQGPPPYAQPGAQPANQPGGPAYMEAIETGERRGAQRQEDEQNAQVLGGSTDRTGKRVRPTRTGEQARAYRAAHDQYIETFEAAERSRQQASRGWGEAASTAFYTRQAGIRPLDQAMMARRLVMMNAGVPQGI